MPTSASQGGFCDAGEYCPGGSSAPLPCDGGYFCVRQRLALPTGPCQQGTVCTSADNIHLLQFFGNCNLQKYVFVQMLSLRILLKKLLLENAKALISVASVTLF